jgi:hypothetical protein
MRKRLRRAGLGLEPRRKGDPDQERIGAGSGGAHRRWGMNDVWINHEELRMLHFYAGGGPMGKVPVCEVSCERTSFFDTKLIPGVALYEGEEPPEGAS